MNAVNNVLVIGGGFSGMAAAIQMRKAGIYVELIEQDPNWCPLGAGITVNGPSLRALDQLGLYQEFVKYGALHHNLDVYANSGDFLTTVPTLPPQGAEHISGGGGIMRPILARVMSKATCEAGVEVRLGCTFTDIKPSKDHVTVTLSDGTTKTYDLVIGADGVHSTLRDRFFPEITPPEYLGQCVWRAVMPTPDFVERPCMWLGNQIKLGMNPVSKTHVYMYITENRPYKDRIKPEHWPILFADLIRHFKDPRINDLVDYAFADDANVDYRPLANLLVPQPWNRGRLVMIGDTMAATTPHLASGAGIGIESGIVLGQELAANDNLQTALDRFHTRRWERCAMVINNSARLCELEINGGDKKEHSQLMADSMAALTGPF
jgi:2-polyprenyl-6-methoxyphenol hydroxylase-like FAD-dependent oxidoreductase